MKIEFAIVDANILTCIGLSQLLSKFMPMVEITTFRSYEELIINQPERFVHLFVSSGIYFEHSTYFKNNPHRSIVLVHGDSFPMIPGLLTLNVCQDEVGLMKRLFSLKKMGDVHHPEMDRIIEPLLSPRETEVAVLLAKGYINKEIADSLHISLSTVITHRKSIMEKLHARSLADVVLHVVMQGFITVDDL